MATTAITFGNEFLSTTMYVLMKEWRDGVGYKHAFLEAYQRVHGKGGKTQAGGTRIVQPLGFGEHSKTTRMQTGYERIDLSVSDVFVPAVFDWGSVRRPVAISGEEEFINSGEAKVLDILQERTMMAAEALRRECVKHIVQNNVAGWQDWGSLNGVDAASTGYTAGYLEENAVASQTNSVGGVSKSTYSAKKGWQNQRYDGSASFNSNGLAGLYDLRVETKAVSASDESGKVILASRSAVKNLKRSLSAYERYIDSTKLDGGRMVEYWDGTQIETEYDMPDAGATTTADPISFYFVDLHDIYPIFDPKGFFFMTPFENVSGEFETRRALIRVRGQLIAKHLGSSGIGFDLNTF